METYIIRVNGVEYEVEVEKKEGNTGQMQGTPPFNSQSQMANSINGANSQSTANLTDVSNLNQTAGSTNAVNSSKNLGIGQKLIAGAAGKVWKVVLKEGSKVLKGEAVVVIEAMKMEIPVVSPIDGTVTSITVAEGDGIEAGQVIATVA